MKENCVDRDGQQFGNYRLSECLGGGGFACVYKGTHIYLQTEAAVKLLHSHITSQEKEMFLKEARTIARLKHPHIVQVLEFGIEAGTPFLVMAYTPQGSLRLNYPKGSVLPLPLIVSYVRQIASALQHAHDYKVIHRDIKPENMLLGEDNGLLLSDFGIATIIQSTYTLGGQNIAGTVTYMAPEQIQGKPRRASDQYALGIAVYEWLCGICPFNGSSWIEIAMKHVAEPPPSLQKSVPNISPLVEEVVLKALAKDPKQRYTSVVEFANALEQASKVVGTSQFIYSGHSWGACTAAWSPDGTYIVSGSSDNTVQIWNATTGILYFTYRGHSESVDSVAWSPDGTYIASAEHYGKGQIWEVTTGSSIASFDGGRNIVWSPDGTRIASIKFGRVQIWDVTTGDKIITYHGHDDVPRLPASDGTIEVSEDEGARAVAWSPDGTRIASGGDDNTAQIWNATTGKLLLTYRGHSSSVHLVVWSPDGMHIASVGGDTTVQIWDVASGTLLLTYRGHSQWTNVVAWSPNGKLIASSGEGDTIQLWSPKTGKLLFTHHGHSKRVDMIVWSPNSRRIASGGHKEMQVWDAPTGKLLLNYHGHSQRVEIVMWSPDGDRIASGALDGTVQVWNAATGKLLLTYPGHSSRIKALAWSPDGTRIASWGDVGTIQIWDTITGNNTITYSIDSIFKALAWSPDGDRIASGAFDGTVQVWNAATGKLLLTYPGHSSWIKALAWSPDGTHIASCVDSYPSDKMVHIWDATTGNNITTYNTDVAYTVAWSPNGNYIAVGGSSQIQVWNTVTEDLLLTYYHGHSNGVDVVAWSPDGTRIASYDSYGASGGGMVHIWDASTGKTIFTPNNHVADVHYVSWSPGGAYIACAGYGVEIWYVSRS